MEHGLQLPIPEAQAAMGVGHIGAIGGIIGDFATGMVMGLINGLLMTTIGIPPFLVTLAMMGIATGTAESDSRGTTV